MSENQDKVAVVIVNYNGGKLIHNCLAALANQTVHPDQIIVVDNNSSDGSNAQIRTLFPSTKLIQLSDNVGFAAANNRAFQELKKFKWVALLNPDTVPDNAWLEQLLNTTRDCPHSDVFASRLVDIGDETRIDGAGDIYHVSGLSWRRHHGLSINQTNLHDDPVFSPCAAAALFKLESVIAIGGFDESYFCYNEDVDLVFRMRLTGAQCTYVKTSVVAHVGSGLTGKDSDFSVYHGHRNLVWTYFKNMPGWLVIWYLPQHLLLNLVTLIYYTSLGRGPVIWKSKWHAIRGLPEMLKKRKKIQKERTINPFSITDCMTKGLLRPYVSRFK